jgi:hypothetical protein
MKRERTGTFLADGKEVGSSGFDGNGDVEWREGLGSAALGTGGAEFLFDLEAIANDGRQVCINSGGGD